MKYFLYFVKIISFCLVSVFSSATFAQASGQVPQAEACRATQAALESVTAIASKDNSEGGIGGTGRSDDRANSGDGGIGGTGIIGTIEGFGSICVNGLKVEWTDATRFLEGDRPSKRQRLQVGQQVAVLAEPSSNTASASLIARQVQMIVGLHGPITEAPDESGFFKVMGAPIRTKDALMTTNLEQLKPGQWVELSGVWLRDHSFAVSWMQLTAAAEVSTVTGPATSASRIGAVNLSNVVADGDYLVRGIWRDDRLQVQLLKPLESLLWARQPDRFVLEMFMSEDSDNPVQSNLGIFNRLRKSEEQMAQLRQLGPGLVRMEIMLSNEGSIQSLDIRPGSLQRLWRFDIDNRTPDAEWRGEHGPSNDLRPRPAEDGRREPGFPERSDHQSEMRRSGRSDSSSDSLSFPPERMGPSRGGSGGQGSPAGAAGGRRR